MNWCHPGVRDSRGVTQEDVYGPTRTQIKQSKREINIGCIAEKVSWVTKRGTKSM